MTTAVADPQADEETADAKSGSLGRVIDVAGVAAAFVLGVILFDVFSGGKVTRWVTSRRQGGCQGCGEGDPGGD
jgi:hypothetical protein